jgi:hypothetical protein
VVEEQEAIRRPLEELTVTPPGGTPASSTSVAAWRDVVSVASEAESYGRKLREVLANRFCAGWLQDSSRSALGELIDPVLWGKAQAMPPDTVADTAAA